MTERYDQSPSIPAKGVVKSGVIWIAAGFGTTQVIRFGSSVVMAGLLYPQAFGLFALSYAFLVGLHLFSDLGIRLSIIQNERGENQAFLDTAWTIQVVRGFIIWLAAFALSWPIAFWRPEPEPDLLWLLPTIAFSAVIEGFVSTKLHGLYRHLQQRRAVTIELLCSSGGICVMVAMAYFNAGLYAMAAGPLTTAAIQLLLSHLLPGPANRFRWDPRSARELVHFGRWIFLSTVFSFLADQSDRVVVSYFSMAMLGVYHLANQIANVPYVLMGSVARQIVMPLYSRMLQAGKDVEESLRMIQVRTGAATSLLIGGLIAIGPSLIRCLYDDRYEQAAWILPLLTIVMMINIFDNNGSSLLIARGKGRTYALSNAIKVLCLAVFMPLGAWIADVRGLIFAMILGEMGRYICTGIALQRDGLPIFRRDVGWAIFALAIGFGAHELANAWLPIATENRHNRWMLATQMALAAGIVVACWGAVVLSAWKAGWFQSRDRDELTV